MSTATAALYRNLFRCAHFIDARQGGFVAGDAAVLIASACRREAAETRLGALLASAHAECQDSAGTATASLQRLASLYTKGGDESVVTADAAVPSASVADNSLSALVKRAFRAPVDDVVGNDIGSRLDAAFAILRDWSFVERAARCSADLDAIFARNDAAAITDTTYAAWSACALESMEDAAILRALSISAAQRAAVVRTAASGGARRQRGAFRRTAPPRPVELHECVRLRGADSDACRACAGSSPRQK